MRMTAQHGDDSLEHLKKGPENAMYVPKTAQNEALQVCSSMIKGGVVTRCNEARFGPLVQVTRPMARMVAVMVRYVASVTRAY